MNDSGMQLPHADSAQGATADFAGMLANVRSSERSARAWLAAEDDFEVQEEIFPLSYEQALKKHARRPGIAQTTERIDRVASLLAENLAERRAQSATATSTPASNLPLHYTSASDTDWPINIDYPVNEVQQQNPPSSSATQKIAKAIETKAVSVTLRMSHQEAGQVRQRAADAGLTISAYIRSCVCEAEVLRAQVKTALQELRQASVLREVSTPTPANRPWWNRLAARG